MDVGTNNILAVCYYLNIWLFVLVLRAYITYLYNITQRVHIFEKSRRNSRAPHNTARIVLSNQRQYRCVL